MSRERWVPTSQLAVKSEGTIELGYAGMPDAFDLDRLHWDVSALRSAIIGWGGFTGLTLASEAGEADKMSLDASSTQHGVGVAGGVRVHKAPDAEHRIVTDAIRNAFHIRNNVLNITWKMNALNRIPIDQQYNPAVRADQLNKSIKLQAIAAIWKHNAVEPWQDMHVGSKLTLGMSDAVAWTPTLENLTAGDYRGAAMMLSFGVAQRFAIWRPISVQRTGAGLKDTVSDPLFLTMRPARAAIATGILATNMLVRAV